MSYTYNKCPGGRSALCECSDGKQGPTSFTRTLRAGDRRTAMAFGEFGFLNGIALQKRTETEKGTNFILRHSKKLSVGLLFLFVCPVRVHIIIKSVGAGLHQSFAYDRCIIRI